MIMIKVLKPGFLTTVQDFGRFGYAHLGISASGAADALSLRVGNLLVGNSQNAAALEMTLTGGVFEFEADSIVAVTGSDFGPTVRGGEIPRWSSVAIKAGDRLECGPTKSGARCYLCIHGGISCQQMLGSVSTHLLTGIGGIDGRALKKGDLLKVGDGANPSVRLTRLLPSTIKILEEKKNLLVTAGPQRDWFAGGAQKTFFSSTYSVSEDSNRMGLRLNGPVLSRVTQKEMLTEGVSLGAIQVPQSGQPIILFVEHQTTGGYPKIANVITADFHRLGQLRPRDVVQFEAVSFERADELFKQQETLINPQSFIPA